MIIVQLKGGLGNQLFQYAAGLSLARQHGVIVKVDISELNKADDEIGTLRNFELQHIRGVPEIASHHEIDIFLNMHFLKKYFQKLLPSFKRQIYKEASFSFDTHFFAAGNHLYLKGYRQSEKYFFPIRKIIQQDFLLQDKLTIHLIDVEQRLQTENSVAVHIRRGDYSNKALLGYHGLLDQTYYQLAITVIEKQVNDPVYFIFSDNIEWVKQHLNFSGNVVYVSGTVTKNHYEDFTLMSKCRHNIIANSSFSWWAAYLNTHVNKIVIAPQNWFNKVDIATKDLFPDKWNIV